MEPLVPSKWRVVRDEWVVFAVVFFGSVSFSIVLPTLWPFMQHVRPSFSPSLSPSNKEMLMNELQFGLSLTQFGVVVSCYSIGQLVASPLFGSLSDRLSVHSVLLICMGVGVIGKHC